MIFEGYLVKLKKFKDFLGGEVWRLFFVSVIIGIILFFIESSFVFVFQGFLRAIGLVTSDKLTLAPWYPESLNSSILLFLGFGVARAGILMIRHYVNSSTGMAFMRLQRNRIIEYGLTNPDTVSSHVLFSTASDKVTHAGYVLQHLSLMILMGTTCILFFLMGIKMAPVEMILGLILLLVAIVPLRKLNVLINTSGVIVSKGWENFHKIVVQSHKHNFFLKSYGLLKDEIEKAQEQTWAIEQNQKGASKVIAIKSYFPSLVGMAVICLITYSSVRFFHTPSIVLVSFLYLFMRLAQGAGDVSGAFSEFRLGLPSFKQVYRFHELLKDQKRANEIVPEELALEGGFFNDGITLALESVSFGFPGKFPVIRDLNISVKRGELLLVKGPSGAGKSTLLSLMFGFRSPQSGRVLVNGKEIGNLQQQIYSKLAYVGPEPYMIEGTLRDNLLFGHYSPNSVSSSDLYSALEVAQLGALDLSLDTFINEQTPLSTGQKQRIALARAILRKPLMLILDEATANLDEETENGVIRELLRLTKSMTTIVTSHKSSFDAIASKTLVMNRLRSFSNLEVE